MSGREAVKNATHALAWVLVTPSVWSFEARAVVLGRDRALEHSTQLWALVPGLVGQYLRRAFLSRALTRCERTATIEFGTLFSSASATIGHHAYIGPRCHLGWVHIEDDVLIAAAVHVPSGPHTHGTGDPDTPIREQTGAKRAVRIGAGAWIGSNAVVLADVGRGSIVGAGAVVTGALPDRVVAGGVPARVLRERESTPAREREFTPAR
jgi:acetyltransferase-like isoleucine patch superfamily enzyme